MSDQRIAEREAAARAAGKQQAWNEIYRAQEAHGAITNDDTGQEIRFLSAGSEAEVRADERAKVLDAVLVMLLPEPEGTAADCSESFIRLTVARLRGGDHG